MSFQAPPSTLYCLYTKGTEPNCGLQCCCFHWYSSPPQVDIAVEAIPVELLRMYSVEEFQKFGEKFNAIYEATAYPLFPGAFTHFCIPFSPLCGVLHFQSKRRAALEDLIRKTNEELKVRELKWELMPVLTPTKANKHTAAMYADYPKALLRYASAPAYDPHPRPQPQFQPQPSVQMHTF